MARLPLIKDLIALISAVKEQIRKEYRAFEEDDVPGIQLTVGWNDKTGEWSYQTGDNSYSGAAYFYPHWAIIGVYRRTNCRKAARDIRDQLLERVSW